MPASMTQAEARRAARALAVARTAIGATALLAPKLPARPWIGGDADRPSSKLLARALGGRDLALGIGALLALSHEGPVRGWLEAGGLADAGDVAATLLGWRATPRFGRWAVLLAAGSGVAMARVLAPVVD